MAAWQKPLGSAAMLPLRRRTGPIGAYLVELCKHLQTPQLSAESFCLGWCFAKPWESSAAASPHEPASPSVATARAAVATCALGTPGGRKAARPWLLPRAAGSPGSHAPQPGTGTGRRCALERCSFVGEKKKKAGQDSAGPRVPLLGDALACPPAPPELPASPEPTVITVLLGSVSWVCRASRGAEPCRLRRPPKSREAPRTRAARCRLLAGHSQPSVTGDISPGVAQGRTAASCRRAEQP